MKTLLLIAAVIAVCEPAYSTEWGCYDPKPGHPSSSEKQQFVDTVSQLAVKAEQKYGVPAAAIAAMAIAESGYGWTRTAIEANNFYGWKYYSAGAAAGRSFYVLECQPAFDKNNKYVRFAGAADAVDFVASKLASMPSYKGDTQRYQQAIKSGMHAVEASRAWVAGIADPYNWDPPKYTQTITRLMNDPISPSSEISSQRNLYQLTGGPKADPPAPAAAATGIESIAGLDEARRLYRTKLGTTARQCDPPNSEFARWKGFPVQRCKYSDSGVVVQTHMLNPTTEQLARWTATACREAQATDTNACIQAVAGQVIGASSGVFPVSGFIPEPASSAGGSGNKMYCYLFRDGVTVRTEQFKKEPAAEGGACPYADDASPVTRAKRFARVASTTRTEYAANGGAQPVGTDKDGDPRWVDVIRDLYQKAWNSDRNELISAKAKAMRAEQAYKKW